MDARNKKYIAPENAEKAKIFDKYFIICLGCIISQFILIGYITFTILPSLYDEVGTTTETPNHSFDRFGDSTSTSDKNNTLAIFESILAEIRYKVTLNYLIVNPIIEKVMAMEFVVSAIIMGVAGCFSLLLIATKFMKKRTWIMIYYFKFYTYIIMSSVIITVIQFTSRPQFIYVGSMVLIHVHRQFIIMLGVAEKEFRPSAAKRSERRFSLRRFSLRRFSAERRRSSAGYKLMEHVLSNIGSGSRWSHFDKK